MARSDSPNTVSTDALPLQGLNLIDHLGAIVIGDDGKQFVKGVSGDLRAVAWWV
jgi:hypothetical protein